MRNPLLTFKRLTQLLLCAVTLGLWWPVMGHAAAERPSAQSAKVKKSDTKAKVRASEAKSSKAKRDDKRLASKVNKASKAKKDDRLAKRNAQRADRRVASKKSSSKANTRQARVSQRNILVASKTRPAQVERAALVTPVAAALPAFAPMTVSADIVPRSPASSMAQDSQLQRASFGRLYGLHETRDPLELQSSVALVVDQDTNEVVFAKNSDAVLPIASLTKLMTALVVTEAQLSLDEMLTVTSDDVDTIKHSSSRLPVGATLTRGELLHLALMSSENRAAHALGRTYPGGLSAFVSAMNAKARLIGMHDSRFADPTGLSNLNQSSARDLATLARFAYQNQLIRELSTSPEHAVSIGHRQLQYRNTNSLVRSSDWDIGLQKTGYIVEAGRCLVMQARMAGRKFIMVFLDSAGKRARLSDAERIRRWIEMAAEEGSLGVYLPRAKLTS